MLTIHAWPTTVHPRATTIYLQLVSRSANSMPGVPAHAFEDQRHLGAGPAPAHYSGPQACPLTGAARATKLL
jgi:hypothetical protein